MAMKVARACVCMCVCVCVCVCALVHACVCVFFCILLLCCKRPLFTLLHSEFRNGHSSATLLHVNFIIPKQIHTHFRTRCGSPFPLHHALLRQLVAHSASAGQACKKLELFVIWLRYRKKNVKQRGTHHTERKWNVHRIVTTDAHSVNSRDRHYWEVFRQCYSVFWNECWDSTLKHERFLPHPSQFVTYNRSTYHSILH
jgi:hypothetical protein